MMAPMTARPAARPIRALLAAALATLLAASGATPAAAAAPTLSAVVIQQNLIHPWDVAFDPLGRMYVTERRGKILLFQGGGTNAPRLRTHTISNVHAEGESGLMGITVDPAFSQNRFIYVCVSREDEGEWRNQVMRYVVNGSSFYFDRYVIRSGIRAATIHDGCRLRFGPDGKLWITMGDANVSSRAQDPDSLNGKVLRVNRDGSIPSDNPILKGAAGRTAAYSFGHRNPQGLAFHPDTGVPYEIEHGPSEDDEINRLRPGANFGWPNQTGADGPGGYYDPCWESNAPTIATSGGDFGRTAAWGDYRNHLFVATLKEQDLRRFSFNAEGTVATQRAISFNGTWGRLRGVTAVPSGRLYVTTSNGSNDKVIRITPVLP